MSRPWIAVLLALTLAAVLGGCQTYEAYPSETDRTHPYQYYNGVGHQHEQFHY